jgi:hypothetical protein
MKDVCQNTVWSKTVAGSKLKIVGDSKIQYCVTMRTSVAVLEFHSSKKKY